MRKKRVYAGKPVSIDVYNLTVEGRKVRREIIQHPGAAAILAFDENGKVSNVGASLYGDDANFGFPFGK